jgi:hypothetical protein
MLLLAFSLTANADDSITTGKFLEELLTTYHSACSEGGAWYEQLKKPDAIALDARGTVCECIPERAAKLRDSLSPTELALPLPGTMQQRYMSEVVDPCAARSARLIYGKSCVDHIGKSKANSVNYCSCMADFFASISDRDATQIGRDAAQYVPAVQQAKKRGSPPPESPPTYARFMSAESACSKK